jgi:hypothetical protein
MLFQISIFLQDIRQGNKPAYIGMFIFMTTGVAQLILAAKCTTGIFFFLVWNTFGSWPPKKLTIHLDIGSLL